MNRNDYKKLMQLKKRNKLVVKGLFLLTFGITTGFIANETAQAQEWTPNQSTTIKTGDTQYEIQWGDYLGLISQDSGLTIETLTTLNNISNENLIFAGNIIQFGDGITAKVTDTNGNVIAETPLTEADKAGIAEKSQASPIKVTKNNSDSTTTGTSTGSNAGNNAENPTLPTAPILPTEPVIPPTAPVVPPVLPIDPEKEEVEFNVVYLRKQDINQSGGMSEVEKVKGIAGETLTLTADPDRYTDEGYWLASEPTVTVTVEKDMAMVIFTYVNHEVPEINEGQVSIHFLDEVGNTIKESKIYSGELGENFLILGEPITGYELVGNTEYSGIYTENAQSFNFIYTKNEVAPPVEETADVTIKHVSTTGEVLASSTITANVGETVTGMAESFDGYTLQGASTQSITATNGAVMTFTYVKDEVVVPPVENVTVTVQYVSNDGTLLDSYTEVALEGTVVTARNKNFTGYTIADVYNKTIVAVEGAVLTVNYTTNENGNEIGDWGQRPTSNSELASGEWNGTYYNDFVGNSGMTFANLNNMDGWAFDYIDSSQNTQGYKGYWFYEVRMEGTNEIRLTVDFY